MQTHVTDVQFFVGSFALICVAVVTLAAFLDFRRKRRSSQLNYYCNNFHHEEFERNESHKGSISMPDDLES